MPAVRAIAGSLGPGTELPRYRIESLIGAGGMGEVYAARDTQLGRRVALKVLRASMASDERIARFIREAEAASALNHPAIVSIFDSGSAEVDGERIYFIAMELVDGETLAEWSRAKHDARRKIELLAAIADGLARAHAGGIVHRDLKPANILVGRGGYPKIADFGIAKLTERGARPSEHETAPEALLGTAAYMSPEQVVGGNVDARSDVFSFGCVAYEVVTGRPPFRRSNAVESMHAILNDEPPLDAVAPPMRRIIRRCLAKDPDDRYQSMRDVALDLREIAAEPEPPRAPLHRGNRTLFLIAALFASMLLALLTRAPSGKSVVVTTTTAAAPAIRMERLTNSGQVVCGAISPDGKVTAFVAKEGQNQTLWLKQIATGTSVRVMPPYDGYFARVEVSPDNSYIYFSRASREEPNVVDLFRVPAVGGEARKIVPDMESIFTLSPDGTRVAFRRFNAFQRDYILCIADVTSGAETELQRRHYPDAIGTLRWSPDPERLDYVQILNRPGLPGNCDIRINEINVGTRAVRRLDRPGWRGLNNWLGIQEFAWLRDGSGLLVCAGPRSEPAQIWMIPLAGGPPRKVTADLGFYASISVTDDAKNLVAFRMEDSANIWLVTFDGGERARPLTTGPGNRLGDGGVFWLDGGRIVFTAPGEMQRPQLDVVGLSGGEMRQLTRTGVFWGPRVSPDRSRLAYVSDESHSLQVWISDANGENRRQLTHDVRGFDPSFFPDGKSIAFISASLNQRVARMSIDGGAVERLTDAPAHGPSVSPDGKSIICRLRSTDPKAPLWRTALLPLDHKGATRYFDVPRFGGGAMLDWSADSKGFYFIDNAGGTDNVWLQPIDGGAPRQLTHFDSGRIYSYQFAPDGKSVAISRGDPASDLVLIRDFR
jgi:eukaryotic-like serine/threonine-protein kinase